MPWRPRVQEGLLVTPSAWWPRVLSLGFLGLVFNEVLSTQVHSKDRLQLSLVTIYIRIYYIYKMFICKMF